MDCLYPSNAADVKLIRAMILSDYISDDSIHDGGNEWDDNYVEQGERDSGLCRNRYVG
jgi:hypothetical protein